MATQDTLYCSDPRCHALIAARSELCDQCGNSDLRPIGELPAYVLATAADHEVVFPLDPTRPNIVGRQGGTASPPLVDLARLPDSGTVHHEHARIERQARGWLITQLGRNPLVVRRPGEVQPLEQSSTCSLMDGDMVTIGRVTLRFASQDGGA